MRDAEVAEPICFLVSDIKNYIKNLSTKRFNSV